MNTIEGVAIEDMGNPYHTRFMVLMKLGVGPVTCPSSGMETIEDVSQ